MLKSEPNYHEQSDKMGLILKTKHDNDVTNRNGVIYT